MPFSRDYVLCFGRDHILQYTRRQILEQAGYATLGTSDMLTVATHLLGGDVGILVLCHSLTEKETDVICRFHQEMLSTAVILCLSSGLSDPSPERVQVCNAHKGPREFLAAVARLDHSLEACA